MPDYIQELFELELRGDRLDTCHDEIHAKLGLDFLDRLNDLEGEICY